MFPLVTLHNLEKRLPSLFAGRLYCTGGERSARGGGAATEDQAGRCHRGEDDDHGAVSQGGAVQADVGDGDPGVVNGTRFTPQVVSESFSWACRWSWA